MDLNLKNRVAIVTGGSRGLGRAICLGLAAEGVKVAISYLANPEANIDLGDEAAELAKVIRAGHGVKALPVGGDVAKEADIERLFAAAERELGPVDILVNNAGVWPTGFVRDMSEAEFSRVLQINLVGAFLTCREAVRRWLAAKRPGRIVNITSQAAFNGATSGHAHYAASKAGVNSLCRHIASKWGQKGIRCNVVSPGFVLTEQLDANMPQQVKDWMLKGARSTRHGAPRDIAGAVAEGDQFAHTHGQLKHRQWRPPGRPAPLPGSLVPPPPRRPRLPPPVCPLSRRSAASASGCPAARLPAPSPRSGSNRRAYPPAPTGRESRGDFPPDRTACAPTPPAGVPRAEVIGWVIANLRALTPVAERLGIKIAVENHGDLRIAELERILDEASPYIHRDYGGDPPLAFGAAAAIPAPATSGEPWFGTTGSSACTAAVASANTWNSRNAIRSGRR